jgi:hypothetical protein
MPESHFYPDHDGVRLRRLMDFIKGSRDNPLSRAFKVVIPALPRKSVS